MYYLGWYYNYLSGHVEKYELNSLLVNEKEDNFQFHRSAFFSALSELLSEYCEALSDVEYQILVHLCSYLPFSFLASDFFSSCNYTLSFCLIDFCLNDCFDQQFSSPICSKTWTLLSTHLHKYIIIFPLLHQLCFNIDERGLEGPKILEYLASYSSGNQLVQEG